MIHFRIPCLNLVLYLFILVCSLALVISSQNETDKELQALLCFKSRLSDPAGALSSWSNPYLDFCNWHGVSCGSAQSPHHVTSLDLSSEGLTDSIPSCIANLTSLKRLQLSNNSFHGSIPPELGLLTQLTYLNLSMNSLNGGIPSAISSCTQLQVLDLSNNSLEGDILPTLSQCKNIQMINLSNNKLQGSIPAAFGMLQKLRTLILAGNSLSGSIPPSLGSSSLIHVDLGRNFLSGGIPESLVNSSLQVLRLMSNRLTGKLPEALFNSSSLTTICLQQNIFVGYVPPVASISSPLKYLSLQENNLSGSIPVSLGNLSSLIFLSLQQNNLIESIPESLGNIRKLQVLRLTANKLSGLVPPSVFNVSSLKFLGLGSNLLSGRLPSNIGNTLPNIQTLVLISNRFYGTIPDSLLNASHLEKIYMAFNMLTGFVPSFGSLPNLEVLDVGGNMLESGDWSFLSSLSNCTRLTRLMLDSNNLQGNLPLSIGNLPNSIEHLWIRDNKISGPIPLEIANLTNLVELYMGYNLLNGSMPPTILQLHDLVRLGIARNKLSGHLPHDIGRLSQLNELRLEQNNLTGSIPASIGNCTQLQKLNLSHNSLAGSIPSNLLQISSLSIYLDLSYNHLSGEIPEEVGNLINLNLLNISNNMLSSNIPSTLGQCVLLESLQMQNNFFEGSIPQSFINLVGIKELDLSENNLSGTVPGFLTSLSSLRTLNLSFNNFDGVVPMGGIFSIVGAVSIQGNDRLCTNHPALGLPLCAKLVGLKGRHRSLVPRIVLPIVPAIVITLSCVVIVLKRKKKQSVPQIKRRPNMDMKRITFQDIIIATNQFSSANLVGSGSFGTVYKGCLKLEDSIVAIKIFNLEIFGADKSFTAECGTLKNIRHRNLVKVITLCSSVDLTGKDFKALVFKYMPNGNLEMWLHPEVKEQGHIKTISLSQRINVALDVAFALDYLHNHCAYPLIHCDLKPSNVLLDLDMTACVGDFGLARFLCTGGGNGHHNSSASLAYLKGSIGYIPPEYGLSVEISAMGDVYSFGVLLLEMITGRRPTDENFKDGITLHEYVYRAFPNNIYGILDPVLLQDDEMDATDAMENCIIPLVRVGLSCSMASPKARLEMGKVCTEILAIKDSFSII
ncbi:hypothetical protein C2845_PMPSC004514 [Panicum miliaceum]|uniref:Receptor kinase-like protein Xa21 n=1 Tax=Panicum miliaceum TaxID=4540 RepID=A0A3L6P9E1_PANMI|nr:hypothetical protein C2845_PMPSC004514 [Panicum miliaceum]